MNKTHNEIWWWEIVNSTRMGQYLFKKDLKFIKSSLKSANMNFCLDIGGGSGRITVPLSKLGIDVVVLDKDPVPIQILHEKDSGIPICLGDAQQLPFKDSIFDCIICLQMVDYLLNKKLFFDECNRILKHGGFLLINIGNKQSYRRFIRSLFLKIRNKHDRKRDHFYTMSYKEYVGHLKNHGFEIHNVFGYEWIPAGRASNSPFIPLYASIERYLGLGQFPSVSPRVFIKAKKIA